MSLGNSIILQVIILRIQDTRGERQMAITTQS